MKTTVYVGMALTEAPEEFRKELQLQLKSALREKGFEVLDFIGLENGTAPEVYRYDINCARVVDYCIFICDYPSTGMGMEIMARRESGKPMCFFARKRSKVTRMIIGMCDELGYSKPYEYRSPDEIVQKFMMHEVGAQQ